MDISGRACQDRKDEEVGLDGKEGGARKFGKIPG
jgi:hypothetical protein